VTFHRYGRNFGEKYVVFWAVKKTNFWQKFIPIHSHKFIIFSIAQNTTQFLPKLPTIIWDMCMYSRNNFYNIFKHKSIISNILITNGAQMHKICSHNNNRFKHFPTRLPREHTTCRYSQTVRVVCTAMWKRRKTRMHSSHILCNHGRILFQRETLL
jgi:hypothetical protein